MCIEKEQMSFTVTQSVQQLPEAFRVNDDKGQARLVYVHLLSDVEMFKMLLASGMSPDLPNWQQQTLLHDVCGGGGRGKAEKQLTLARILLNAGATISAREDVYRSTPLAFAARTNMPDMVELLLSRGAPTNLYDDEPWATPLAWAQRRGHAEIAEILRNHGATK